MTTVTISPKFQIVIPKEVRTIMNLNSGMKIAVIPYGDRIELIPIQPIEKLRGILKGMDMTNIREKKDRI